MQRPLPLLTTFAALAALLPPPSGLYAQTQTPLPPAVDRDGDGHSDLWQLLNGIPSANGPADSDGDGLSDQDEEKAGTNPWSMLSFPGISQLELLTDGRGGRTARLHWDGLAGKRYQFSSSPDFSSATLWQDAGDPVQPEKGGPLTADFTVPAGDTRRFFRAAVSDVDEDRDGLTAFEERIIGTSDLNPRSGGLTAPPDTETALDWANHRDPGIDTGPAKASLREVSVAFVRKNPASGAADVVTAVGSGAWHQLTSWRAGAGNPVALFTAPPVDGHHPKVLLLSPAKDTNVPKFLSGRIRPDGSLWLSCRSLAAGSGAFVHHQSNGWNPGTGQDVVEYDMAQGAVSSRTAGLTHYQVVTVLRLRSRQENSPTLHVLTWRVDAVTGAVKFLKDNTNFTHPGFAAAPRIRVAHISGDQFEIVFTSPGGKQVHQPLWTDDDGNAFGNATSGVRDIRGEGLTGMDQEASAIGGLTSSGFVTALRQPGGAMKLAVWDRRPQPGMPGIYVPHLLTENNLDLLPQLPGVSLPLPQLRDSFAGANSAGDGTGAAMATGDFNGDGFQDAALGAPGRKAGEAVGAGAVFIMNGSLEGMENIEYRQIWAQNSPDIAGDPADNDNFGNALAAGDFNGDGNDDLAVGIPLKDVSGKADAGAVQIIYGTAVGLDAKGNQFITRASLGQQPGALDTFGLAVTTGDFNHDGFADLAIGAPGEAVGGHPGAGAVHVLWGSATGLSTTGSEYLHQDSAGLANQADDGDAFGRALSTGDFNGDKNSDLAVGVPLENVAGKADAGAVQVIYGNAANGFGASNFVTRDGFSGGNDIAGTPAVNDHFGWSLATGDFNKDTAGDLAIGVPGDSVLGVNSGAVQVLHGTILGLTWINEEIIRGKGNLPDAQSLPQFGQANEDLGWSLAAGDCDGDGFKDLIASAPGKTINNKAAAGALFVIRGSAGGLLPADAAVISQDTVIKETDPQNPDAPATNQDAESASVANDKFAVALASADFNADGKADLAAGIPRKDDGDTIGCGAAHYFMGSATYSLTLRTDFQWMAQRREVVRGIVTDLIRENAGGKAAGKLHSHNEFQPAVHMASSTKTMTLLLAVEAIEAGKASLDDDVTASELAGTTGGSKLDVRDPEGNAVPDENGDPTPFVMPGDTMKLRFYLAGMMGESCNRSSVAIGQHIAKKVTGNPDNFVVMMNNRAAQLGMTDSVFGHPAGGWVTHIQDAVTLQREGVKHPLFVKFSSFVTYGDDQPEEILCGTRADQTSKCNNPWKQINSMGDYPGRYTWKGGNGGLWFGKSQADNVPDQPTGSYCTTSRVTTALRMDRILTSCLQQTGGGAEDVQRLLDYGYRKLFTPDSRSTRDFPETGGIVGPEGPVRVRNFAITAWDGHGLTAVIDDHEELKLNVWALNYGSNTMTSLGNTAKSYPLLPGIVFEEPALVDIASVPATGAIADFLTANLVGEHLELKAWRLGQEP
ncbi:MAG: hypothetical protein V4726_13035 [Verrucomicrobiota bacterium]